MQCYDLKQDPSEGPSATTLSGSAGKRRELLTKRVIRHLRDGNYPHCRLIPMLLHKCTNLPSQSPPSPLPEPEDGPDYTALLPDELLLNVFKHIDPSELVSSVQHVNDHWARIAQDDTLWKNFEYKPPCGVSPFHVVSVLRQSPHLRAFTLPPVLDANEVLDALSNHCPRLERLNIEVISRLNVRVLKCLFTRIPELNELQLTQCPVGPMARVRRRLTLRFRSPQGLQMDKSYFYESLSSPVHRSQTYMFIAGFVLKCKKDDIEELKCNFVTEKMSRLIQDCVGLKKLTLEFCDIRDAPKIDLQFIRSLSDLESLELVNYLNDDGLNELFSKGTWSSLKELSLRWCRELSDRTCRPIQANCPNLEKIVIPCCSNITDKGVEYLTKCEALKYIKLSSCSLLTAESVRLVSRVKTLEHLDLTNYLCPVTDYLPYLLKSKQLKVLSLKGCIITRGDINELKSHLKYTKLIIDPPENVV